MSTAPPLALRFAAGSDVGRRRQDNQDSLFASERLLAVADGMGGHAHGEVASSVVVDALRELDGRLDGAGSNGDTDLLGLLDGAVADGARRLTERAGTDAALSGMGTTLTALLWDGARFAVAHIGDSRAYLLRGAELVQLTRDHTMVQALVDSGRMAAEQAAEHPRRSMLMRVLQEGSSGEPDLWWQEVTVGDRLLVCSDGLTGPVPDERIRDILATESDLRAAVGALIDEANAGGGPDNITCVVADVVADGADGAG